MGAEIDLISILGIGVHLGYRSSSLRLRERPSFR